MTSLDKLRINLCLPLAAKTHLMTSYLVILTVKVDKDERFFFARK